MEKVAEWIFVAIVLMIAVFLVVFIKSEAAMCINDPYLYSSKVLGEGSYVAVTIYSPSVPITTFIYNGTAKTNLTARNDGGKNESLPFYIRS